MFKLSDSVSWLLLALATGALATIRLHAGDMPLPAMVVCAVAVACALSPSTREAVARGLLRLLSGSMVRSLVIVVGAVMLIQLLPLEMGLLLAGDVLVYLEAAATVSLIAANTRLRPLIVALRTRFEAGVVLRKERMTRVPRQARTRRPPRANAASDDLDRQFWAFA